MSSIASPTTTTRELAIFANRASMRSRDSRGSDVGLMLGQDVLMADAVGDADRADPFGLRDVLRVAGVLEEVDAAVSGDVDAAELPTPAHSEPHGALDDAGEDHRGGGVLWNQWMGQAGIALALAQHGDLRPEQQGGPHQHAESRGGLVVVVEGAAGTEAEIQRNLEVVFVAVREVRDLGVVDEPAGGRRSEALL